MRLLRWFRRVILGQYVEETPTEKFYRIRAGRSSVVWVRREDWIVR